MIAHDGVDNANEKVSMLDPLNNRPSKLSPKWLLFRKITSLRMALLEAAL